MEPAPFVFQTAASLPRHAGLSADNLRALLVGLRRAGDGCIFWHLHHALFRRHFTAGEFMNDFARWVFFTLHEERLAERLAVLEPLEFPSLAAARERLLREVERHLGQAEYLPHVPEPERFHFLEAQTFVLPTGAVARDPRELGRLLRSATPASIFHHFVAAPARLGRLDNDFSAWLEGQHGLPALAAKLRALSPYSVDLFLLRERMAALVDERC